MAKFSSLGWITLLFSATQASALSPPWYILQNQMRATLGADACIKVGNLAGGQGGNFSLTLAETCGNAEKRKALATLFTRTEKLGNISIAISVQDAAGASVQPGELPSTLAEAQKLFSDALTGNPYFDQVTHGNPYHAFFLEFKPAVVQYFADNAADAHSNINKTTADAFHDVLGLKALRFTFKDLGNKTMGVGTSIPRL